jgi:hydroxybutyrate-dimer hydrolase
MDTRHALAAVSVLLVVAGCGSGGRVVKSDPLGDIDARITEHRDGDDLLSAGLGLAGLRQPLAPAPADPAAPTAAELRRRAIHANWRGIADLGGATGIGVLADAFPAVPGREWSGFATLASRRHPHRVLVQVPDGFDAKRRCLVVTASSGSRGIYGAIALAGGWGLPKGCAVAYTDKGAGSGFFDVDSGEGVLLDGRRGRDGMLDFRVDATAGAAHRVAIKHAHSGDNPEADWGRHVLQAARFGLRALDEAFPAQAPFTAANTRIIAAGLSNGGGAVLRASELDDEGLLDAVVAVAPNVAAPSQGRPLFDYATEAALFAPCALAAIDDPVPMLPPPVRAAAAALRCASLRAAGLIEGDDVGAQSKHALEHLLAQGWSRKTLPLYEQSVAFDLWRAVAATYAQSYARAGIDAPVCGYGFALAGADGKPRASTAAERALWWSDASGIAPTASIVIVDTLAEGADAAFPALLCLRRRWLDGDAALHAGVEATRADARPRTAHVHIVHGIDDALIPIDFSSRAYVADARANGRAVMLTEVAGAQHFDAFLAIPGMQRYRPLLPAAYRALDDVK